MTGILGAVLTFLVGAAAVLLSVMVVLAVLRSLLGGSPGGRTGCWVLLALLFAIWLLSGFLDGQSPSPPPRAVHPAPAVSSL
ncbi:MAG: hypothetical protein M0027_06560 [Candidatus Dormibacteraeota bacterium]|nr:hypothetical protein [Candidatus Dormibacteraeota bacterium]